MRTDTEHFKEIIKQELHRRGQEDPLFAENLKKKGKNIDDCIKYILNTVKELAKDTEQSIGLTDDQVFNIATHYYDEDDIQNSNLKQTFNCDIVLNQQPELNEEEKEELRQKAKEELLREEKDKRKKKSKSSSRKASKDEQQSTLF